ncbi:MAG: hypothetical protein mread185_000433 [Mycoplasmataceae bacterium]|nr:MAG: hypothetical protein mread185_000433 [Mycoplasmataceae bacterium]
MLNNNDKECNNCKARINSNAYKGRNGTFLCGGHWKKDSRCGYNVCFVCGKKETRTEWIEDEDCCGNKRMVEKRISMFEQFERDEDNPDRKLRVHYCDNCKQVAQKSPFKWTGEDEERLIEKEKESEFQEQKKREKKQVTKEMFFTI